MARKRNQNLVALGTAAIVSGASDSSGAFGQAVADVLSQAGGNRAAAAAALAGR